MEGGEGWKEVRDGKVNLLLFHYNTRTLNKPLVNN